jgi:hypothetical protein
MLLLCEITLPVLAISTKCDLWPFWIEYTKLLSVNNLLDNRLRSSLKGIKWGRNRGCSCFGSPTKLQHVIVHNQYLATGKNLLSASNVVNVLAMGTIEK